MNTKSITKQKDIRKLTEVFHVGDWVKVPSALTEAQSRNARIIQMTATLITVQYEASGIKESFLRSQFLNAAVLPRK